MPPDVYWDFDTWVAVDPDYPDLIAFARDPEDALEDLQLLIESRDESAPAS
jgi:predicted RNase H-like HicB family nuclease